MRDCPICELRRRELLNTQEIFKLPRYDSSDIDKLPFKALPGLIGNLPKAVADAELVIYVHVLEHLFDLKLFMNEKLLHYQII